MRKLFVSLLLAVVSAVATAVPVDRQHALLSAHKILPGKRLSEASLPTAARKRMKAANASEAPAFYVFNATDGKGFVLVAGDDAFPEFLGYSETGTFHEDAELPCGLAVFLESYTRYVSDVRAGRAEAPDRRAALRRVPKASVSPLLTCSFGQDEPYNLLCFDANNNPCPCGCVATAVAQIMYYWQWPKVRTGKTGYDWSAVFPTTEENLASPDASGIISQICKDIGTAVGMSYSPAGSGAQSNRVVEALADRFGYVPSTLRHQWRLCFASTDDWMKVIKTELSAGRPIYFSASSTTGTGSDAAGHAFVVDGYNESGMVHVNWGWDGGFNGNYDIVQMNPQAYSFINEQTIITGIQPNRSDLTGTPQYFMQMRSAPTVNDGKSKTQSKTLAFTVTTNNIYNLTSITQDWEYTIGIFDTSLQLLGDINSDRATPSANLASNRYYPEGSVNCKLSAYGDGDYVLRVIFRDKGSDTWRLPDMAGGDTANMIPIRIANKKVTFYAEGVEIITGIDRVSDFAQGEGNTRLTVYSLDGHVLYAGAPEGFSLSQMKGHGVLIVRSGHETRKIAY